MSTENCLIGAENVTATRLSTLQKLAVFLPLLGQSEVRKDLPLILEIVYKGDKNENLRWYEHA